MVTGQESKPDGSWAAATDPWQHQRLGLRPAAPGGGGGGASAAAAGRGPAGSSSSSSSAMHSSPMPGVSAASAAAPAAAGAYEMRKNRMAQEGEQPPLPPSPPPAPRGLLLFPMDDLAHALLCYAVQQSCVRACTRGTRLPYVPKSWAWCGAVDKWLAWWQMRHCFACNTRWSLGGASAAADGGGCACVLVFGTSPQQALNCTLRAGLTFRLYRSYLCRPGDHQADRRDSQGAAVLAGMMMMAAAQRSLGGWVGAGWGWVRSGRGGGAPLLWSVCTHRIMHI